MEIEGPGADQLTVRRDETTVNYGFFTDYPIFYVTGGFTCGPETCAPVNSDVSISGITISNGVGGIDSSFSSLTISGCTISGNSHGAAGGGIYNGFDSTLTVIDSTISGNNAPFGGGITNQAGTMTISGSTISGNSATQAGGVASDTNLSDQKTTITNSTISGNTATIRGGGIYNGDGLSVIENSTITKNTAPSGQGSGVASWGDTSRTSTEVLSTIVSANQGTDGTDGTDLDIVDDTTNSFDSKGYNLIGSGNATSEFIEAGDQTGVTVPKLGPLADNDGPTETHALLAGSPAVDKGNTDLGTDQRGKVRPFDDPSIAPATGGDNSDIGSFEAQEVLIELNSAPKATDDAYSTKEDSTLTINALEGVLKNDTDPNPGDTLTVAAPRPLSGPANGTLALDEDGSFTYTPNANYNGEDSFTYTLSDGEGGTDTATVDLTVGPVNDVPVATDTTRTMNEDGAPITINLASLASDEETSDDSLTYDIVSGPTPAQGTLSGPGSTRTFDSAENFNGSVQIIYTVTDRGDPDNCGTPNTTCAAAKTSVQKTVTVTVSPDNDTPVANDRTESMNEDAAPINIDLGALVSDVETPDANLTYTIVNDPSAQQGTLTGSGSTRSFDSADDFNGSASFTYKVTDRGDPDDCTGAPSATCTETKDSATKTVTITVTAVNDAPSFTKGADETVLEDSGTAGAHSVPNWASAISAGPADEDGQQLTFEVTNNTNSSLFSTEPSVSSTGTLTYTLASEANGEAEVTLSLKDDGGTANGGVDTGAPQTFKITVTAVNDAPSFQLKANPDQTVLEDSGAHSVENFVTNFSPGPSNESGQALLKYLVTNTNNSLFTSSGQPSIDRTGQITYTLAPGAIGTATVSVMAQDDGGTANGGVDTTTTKTFKITLKYNFSGLLSPIPLSSYKVGSTIPVKFTLANAAGTKISDAEARALVASPCKVKVLFSGGTPANNCATYNATNDTFQLNLKVSKSLAAGKYTISVEVSAPDGSGVVNKEGPVEVNIRR